MGVTPGTGRKSKRRAKEMIRVYSGKLIATDIRQAETSKGEPALIVYAEAEAPSNRAHGAEERIEFHGEALLERAGLLSVGSRFTFRGIVQGGRLIAKRVGLL